MTPERFQDDLANEIRKLLEGRLFKNTEGEDVPMRVFEQGLPIIQSDDDDEPIPYVIVRIDSGEDLGISESTHSVKCVVIVGVCDNDLNAQGYRQVLSVINLVYARFQKNPCLNSQYVFEGRFKWILQEDDYHPFYFGAMEMSFTIPAIRREDYLA